MRRKFTLGSPHESAAAGAGPAHARAPRGTVRLVLVVGGGGLVMLLGGPLAGLFAVIALGLTVFGGLTGYVVYKARWQRS